MVDTESEGTIVVFGPDDSGLMTIVGPAVVGGKVTGMSNNPGVNPGLSAGDSVTIIDPATGSVVGADRGVRVLSPPRMSSSSRSKILFLSSSRRPSRKSNIALTLSKISGRSKIDSGRLGCSSNCAPPVAPDDDSRS